MGKINSYQKGARGERAVRDLFRENGFVEAYRTNQFQGNHKDGSSDISNTPYVHVECKWVERLNIDDAMIQAMEDAQLQGKMVRNDIKKKGNKKLFPCRFFTVFLLQWIWVLELHSVLF